MTRFRLLFIFLATSFLAQAQQLPLFTQYRDNNTIINPASVESDFLGFGQNLTFGATYRRQWTGISGAPQTQTLRGSYLNVDMSGVAIMAGGYLMNDQTGPTGFTGLYGRIAGLLTDDPLYGGFSIGLSAGFVQYRVKASEIRLREDGDVLGNVDMSQFYPDVGVGLFFYRAIDGGAFDGDYIYAGLSVPQVLGLDLAFQDENGDFLLKRVQHFYGQLGLYKFFDNDSFLEPSVWVRYAANVPFNADFNIRYQLPTSLWVGTGVSLSKTLHLEAGVVLGENVGWDNSLRIGYGFDHTFSTFGPMSGSTHEINIAFSIYTY